MPTDGVVIVEETLNGARSASAIAVSAGVGRSGESIVVRRVEKALDRHAARRRAFGATATDLLLLVLLLVRRHSCKSGGCKIFDDMSGSRTKSVVFV